MVQVQEILMLCKGEIMNREFLLFWVIFFYFVANTALNIKDALRGTKIEVTKAKVNALAAILHAVIALLWFVVFLL